MLALLAGVLLATLCYTALVKLGLQQEKRVIAVIFIVISAFYPAFEIFLHQGQHFLLHSAIFALCALLALIGSRTSFIMLAALIMLHGVFDLVLPQGLNPAPAWWPAFCVSFDLVFGGLLLWRFLRTPR